MCSYCGCDGESAIAALMADHAVIGDLAYRIGRAVDDERLEVAAGLTAQLAEAFTRHSLLEEAGLFAQMRQAGAATDEIDRLVADHERLRPALSAPDPTSDPSRLRRLLTELTRHAEVEDDDLFPFAMQQLPDARWAELAPTPTAYRPRLGTGRRRRLGRRTGPHGRRLPPRRSPGGRAGPDQ
jgi:hypothetical protein